MKSQIVIITPTPAVIDMVIQNSILRQAVERQVVVFHVVNLRDFGLSNYHQIDDAPFGGGSGMVLMAEPLFQAIEQGINLIGDAGEYEVLYPSPAGELWSHGEALAISEKKQLIVICGHYKGIDERVREKYVTREYSLGDFVVSSGELPAMLMIDSIVRLIPGVLNTYESAMTDSFATDLLDGPHYTRPREIDGRPVPEVLLSGHHRQIEAWRLKQREEITRRRRPDLWDKYVNKRDSGDLSK
ncbi:MAG: tRNA (guanosine(37)-N1)-methyltransferase TrmD [Candidatus Neomarinimicrobiota bacterium]